MNPDQGTELRSGRVINSSSETSSPTDPDMAQANSNDSDTNENSDISSQLSEIKESYERRINELHQEFSQLKDLMMAIVSKNNNESQPSDSGSSFNGCFDNNSSLSYREKLIVEQRRQSSAKSTSMSRCVNNSSFIHPRLAANLSMKLVELFVQCRRFGGKLFSENSASTENNQPKLPSKA